MNISARYCLYFPSSSPVKVVLCGDQHPDYHPSHSILLEDAQVSISSGILYLRGKQVQEEILFQGRFVTEEEAEKYEPDRVVYKRSLFARKPRSYLKAGWQTLKERKPFFAIFSTSTWQVVVGDESFNMRGGIIIE